jgi:uncharacterized protein YqjF (DUF2071 family)
MERPSGIPVMKQTWSELLFLHWPVPADQLRRLVPAALEVDTFEGRAFVGLVPFTVSGSRASFLPPVPFLSSFHEVNVRTYVRHRGGDPAVWFFSLDASSRLAVSGARQLYKLPYHYARIDMQVTGDGGPPGARHEVRFVSRRAQGDRPDVDVRYGPGDVPRPAAPGTLEHFLVERYVLYSASGPSLFRARVHHVPYPLQGAHVEHARETRIASNGLTRPDTEPISHYAAGVDVDIWPLEDVLP